MRATDAPDRATNKNFDHLKMSVSHATEAHNQGKPTEAGVRSTRMTKQTVVDVV
jgi:hypothetical protein